MESSYEDIRRKTMEENKKRMEALNLTHLSQSLHKSSSTISKTSPGRPRLILPGDLEVTKMKHLRRHGLQPTFQAIEPLPSPITTPPTAVQPTNPPPSQAPPSQETTSLVVQTIEPHLSPVTTTPTTVQAT
uniref:B3 domain-containing protein At3g19184-like n=1 Tax=Cicer arietinum TaxID=3827 RepID=A0A3Q7X8E1_CICAR|nr:B3 domain-containing protein At3g19184-like [Cicer arietinum]